LLNKISTHFNIPNAALVVKYVDDERDYITLSSDQELAEAARLARSRKAVLKVFISQKDFPSNNVDISTPPTQFSPIIVAPAIPNPQAIPPQASPSGGMSYTDRKLRKQQKKAEKLDLQDRIRRARAAGKTSEIQKLMSEWNEWKLNWKMEKMNLKLQRRGVHGPNTHVSGQGPTHHAPVAHGQQAKLARGRFVKHVTFPDGSEVSTGQQFIKTWRFRNESTAKWPSDTKLLWVGGDRLSAPASVAIPSDVRAEVDVSVPLVAPLKAGQYISYFRLHGNGMKFGQRVWVQIVVTGDSSGSEKEEAVSDADGTKYQQQLKVLNEMKFNNTKLNIRLLKKFNGDLQAVASRLLAKQQRAKKN